MKSQACRYSVSPLEADGSHISSGFDISCLSHVALTKIVYDRVVFQLLYPLEKSLIFRNPLLGHILGCIFMMLIVRVFPKNDLSTSWNSTLSNLQNMTSEHYRPLYISQQEEKDFMSIMCDVKDIDAFADVLVHKIPSAADSAKTRTITLLKPVFFPAPKDRPLQLERYQVALRVDSDELHNVFNHTVHLDYSSDVFPTYAAYSFGEDDILLSVLSVSRDRITKFVKDNIASQKGVLGVDIARINISMRVAPIEMWRKYRESKYLFKPYDGYEAYDYIEQGALEGAFVRDV